MFNVKEKIDHKVVHILKNKIYIGNKKKKKLYQNDRNGLLWIVPFWVISTSLLMLCWIFHIFYSEYVHFLKLENKHIFKNF